MEDQRRQNKNLGDLAQTTGDNISLTKSNLELAKMKINENNSTLSQPVSAVFKERSKTKEEGDQQARSAKKTGSMELGLKKTLAKKKSERGDSPDYTPANDSVDKSGPSDGRRSRERKERKASRVPDLKAMINRFKMQNKQLAGPKKVSSSKLSGNRKSSSLKARGAHDSSGSLSGTG